MLKQRKRALCPANIACEDHLPSAYLFGALASSFITQDLLMTTEQSSPFAGQEDTALWAMGTTIAGREGKAAGRLVNSVLLIQIQPIDHSQNDSREREV